MLQSSLTKPFTSEVTILTGDEGIQIYAVCKFIKDYLTEKYSSDAKLLTIGKGTSEIQQVIITNRIRSPPPPPPDDSGTRSVHGHHPVDDSNRRRQLPS